MILYHGTTKIRAMSIFNDGMIKKNIDRHYTKEKSGRGYSTQGYVYLTNEITYSLYYANCCNLEDKTDSLYIFKFDIQEERIKPDYDSIRIMDCPDHVKRMYANDLDFSLNELKSCCIDYDICIKKNVEYCIIDLTHGFDPNVITVHAALNYRDVTNQYSKEQMDFINELAWVKL